MTTLPPPTFLVGPARSGTSMAYKLLCLHPATAYISNYVRRAPMLPELAWLNRIGERAPRRRQRAWFGDNGNAYVYGRPRTLTDRAFPTPVEGEPLFRHCGLVEYDDETPLPPPEQAVRLHAAFTRIARAAGTDHVVNKRIANNRRIPALLNAFPQARFVSLVRDGRAVAWSLSRVDWWAGSRVWFYGGTPRQWAAQGRDPWELCARNWVEELEAMDAGLAEVPAGQVLRVRYEDLRAAPGDEMERIGRFAGLPPSPAWRSALRSATRPADRDASESWRTGLDPAALAVVESVQREHLNRLGYLRDGVDTGAGR